MFSCNNTSIGFADFFKSCRQGPTRLKKIGEYLYHYDCVIGSGTYSQVYEGISIQTKKPVAIKVVDLEMVKQKNLSNLLFQQTQLMSQLNHPNVIKCHALLKSENRCYIVMELCRKDNLQTLVEKSKNKKMPTSQIERIIYDIFQGLQYLSQKAIIHRDLKTANILFSQSGKAKIADFGFATHGLSQFKDNVFVGTPLYMSPEAIIQQKYSPKTDIWSFGVIVYELVYGTTPLANCKNEDELLAKIVKHINITPSVAVSEALVEMIEGCLEPNSLYRWSIDKLAKSQYILGLKKRYYIQSNIYQPITTKKTEPESVISMQSRIQDYLVSFNKNQQQSISSKDLSKKNLSSQLKFEKTKESIRSPVNMKNYTSLDQQKKSQQSLGAPFIKKPAKPQIIFVAGKRNYTEISNQSVPLQQRQQRERHSMGFMEPPRSNTRIQLCGPTMTPGPQTVTISNHRLERQCSENDYSNKNSKLTLKSVQTGASNMTLKKAVSNKESPSYLYNDPRDLERKSELPSMNNYFSQSASGFSLLRSKKLTYKHAVTLIHYCRLLHRVLQFPRYFNNYLKKWLVFLVKDLKDNAEVNSLKQAHLQSLRTVLQGYYKQYTSQYQSDIDSKQFIPQTKSVIKILKSLLEIDEQNKDKSMQKQLLIYLLQDTSNLEGCLLSPDPSIEAYVKQSKCELYLDCFNNKDQKNQNSSVKVLKFKQK